MSNAEIKIVKTLRDCRHNEELTANGLKRGLVYDYAVIERGMQRATFKRSGWNNTWELYDNGLRVVKVKAPALSKSKEVIVSARIIDEMLGAYLTASRENAIPTDEQIEARKAAQAEQAAAQDKALAEQRAKQRKEDAAEELYLAASETLKTLNSYIRGDYSAGIGFAHDAKELTAKLSAAIKLADEGEFAAADRSKIKTLDELEAENPEGFRNPGEPFEKLAAQFTENYSPADKG